MGENPRISQLEEVATKSTAMDGIKKTTVLPTLNESDGSVNNMSSPSKTNSENEILVLSQNNSGVESDIRTRKSDRVSGNLKRKELNFAEIMLVHFYIFFLPELVYFPSFTD